MARAARRIEPTIGRPALWLGEPVRIRGDISPAALRSFVLVMHWGIFNPRGPTQGSVILVEVREGGPWLLCHHRQHPFLEDFVAYGLVPASAVVDPDPAPLLPTLTELFARNGADGLPLLQDLPTHVAEPIMLDLEPRWMSRLIRSAAAELDLSSLERDCELLEAYRGDPWQRTRIERDEAMDSLARKESRPPLLGFEVGDELWNRWWALVTDPVHVSSEREQMPVAREGAVALRGGVFGTVIPGLCGGRAVGVRRDTLSLPAPLRADRGGRAGAGQPAAEPREVPTVQDEDTQEARCPHCGSEEDCPHLVAVIDHTDAECLGGYAFERFHEFTEPIEEAFLVRLQDGAGSSAGWNDELIDELWARAKEEYSEGDEDVPVDPYVLARTIADLLGGAGCEKVSGPEDDEWGPGFSSVVTLFYARKPKAVFDKAKRILSRRLRAAGKPRRAEPRAGGAGHRR